jgi:hypothetical protein
VATTISDDGREPNYRSTDHTVYVIFIVCTVIPVIFIIVIVIVIIIFCIIRKQQERVYGICICLIIWLEQRGLLFVVL